jgi:hypothetical protein
MSCDRAAAWSDVAFSLAKKANAQPQLGKAIESLTSRQKIQVCVGQSVVGVSAAVVWKVSEMPNLFRGFCGFFLRGVLTYRYLLNRHCHRGALSLNRNQYHEEVWKERPWRRGRILKSTLCMFELIDCLEDKISWMIEFEQEE